MFPLYSKPNKCLVRKIAREWEPGTVQCDTLLQRCRDAEMDLKTLACGYGHGRSLGVWPLLPGCWLSSTTGLALGMTHCNAQSWRDGACSGQGLRFPVAVYPGKGEQPEPADLHSASPLAVWVGTSHLNHGLSAVWNPGPPGARS